MSSIEYNIGKLIVKCVPFDSVNEMKSRLNELEQGIILETIEGGNQSLLLKVRKPGTELISCCGIVYWGTLKFQVAPHQSGNCLWIGFDGSVFLVSLLEPKCLATIELPCVFYDFVLLEKGFVVAVHELGAVCLDSKGSKKWEISTSDVLTNFRIENKQIICSSDDGQTVSHSIEVTS
jgi:hypothetical protein